MDRRTQTKTSTMSCENVKTATLLGELREWERNKLLETLGPRIKVGPSQITLVRGPSGPPMHVGFRVHSAQAGVQRYLEWLNQRRRWSIWLGKGIKSTENREDNGLPEEKEWKRTWWVQPGKIEGLVAKAKGVWTPGVLEGCTIEQGLKELWGVIAKNNKM